MNLEHLQALSNLRVPVGENDPLSSNVIDRRAENPPGGILQRIVNSVVSSWPTLPFINDDDPFRDRSKRTAPVEDNPLLDQLREAVRSGNIQGYK